MKKILLIASLAALICSSCKENETQKDVASMTIEIAGDASKASDTPTQGNENNIFEYSVLIYDNGLLEKAQTFTTGLTQTITGLTTGLKKVVVLANLPATYTLPAVGDSYGNLASKNIQLDDQQGWAGGLVMTGESTASLAASPATNSVTVKVNRIVAKVILGGITVNQPSGQTGTFVIQSVYVTKVRSLSNAGMPATSPIVTTAPYYGGYANIVVNLANEKTYLRDNITLADFSRYFYVFANDNSDGHATIMGIRATYNGVLSYFPFKINDATIGDGTFIKPNYQYTLNITINNPGTGSPDPEKPSDPATLAVTITPQNWNVVPTQNVSW